MRKVIISDSKDFITKVSDLNKCHQRKEGPNAYVIQQALLDYLKKNHFSSLQEDDLSAHKIKGLEYFIRNFRDYEVLPDPQSIQDAAECCLLNEDPHTENTKRLLEYFSNVHHWQVEIKKIDQSLNAIQPNTLPEPKSQKNALTAERARITRNLKYPALTSTSKPLKPAVSSGAFSLDTIPPLPSLPKLQNPLSSSSFRKPLPPLPSMQNLPAIPEPLPVMNTSSSSSASAENKISDEGTKLDKLFENLNCPVTSAIFLKPVLLSGCVHTLEKWAADRILKERNPKCPCCIIPFSSYKENLAIKNIIEALLLQHPQYKADQYVEEKPDQKIIQPVPVSTNPVTLFSSSSSSSSSPSLSFSSSSQDDNKLTESKLLRLPNWVVITKKLLSGASPITVLCLGKKVTTGHHRVRQAMIDLILNLCPDTKPTQNVAKYRHNGQLFTLQYFEGSMKNAEPQFANAHIVFIFDNVHAHKWIERFKKFICDKYEPIGETSSISLKSCSTSIIMANALCNPIMARPQQARLFISSILDQCSAFKQTQTRHERERSRTIMGRIFPTF